MYGLWMILVLLFSADFTTGETSCEPDDPLISLLRQSRFGRDRCASYLSNEPPATSIAYVGIDSPPMTLTKLVHHSVTFTVPKTVYHTDTIMKTLTQTTTSLVIASDSILTITMTVTLTDPVSRILPTMSLSHLTRSNTVSHSTKSTVMDHTTISQTKPMTMSRSSAITSAHHSEMTESTHLSVLTVVPHTATSFRTDTNASTKPIANTLHFSTSTIRYHETTEPPKVSQLDTAHPSSTLVQITTLPRSTEYSQVIRSTSVYKGSGLSQSPFSHTTVTYRSAISYVSSVQPISLSSTLIDYSSSIRTHNPAEGSISQSAGGTHTSTLSAIIINPVPVSHGSLSEALHPQTTGASQYHASSGIGIAHLSTAKATYPNSPTSQPAGIHAPGSSSESFPPVSSRIVRSTTTPEYESSISRTTSSSVPQSKEITGHPSVTASSRSSSATTTILVPHSNGVSHVTSIPDSSNTSQHPSSYKLKSVHSACVPAVYTILRTITEISTAATCANYAKPSMLTAAARAVNDSWNLDKTVQSRAEFDNDIENPDPDGETALWEQMFFIMKRSNFPEGDWSSACSCLGWPGPWSTTTIVRTNTIPPRLSYHTDIGTVNVTATKGSIIVTRPVTHVITHHSTVLITVTPTIVDANSFPNFQESARSVTMTQTVTVHPS